MGKVAIIMGSKSDFDVMNEAIEILKSFKITVEYDIVSAHRTPKKMIDYAQNAEKKGRKNLISSDVQMISSKEVSAVEPHTIDSLRPHAQLLLLAICRRLKKETEITSGDAETLYKVVCEEYNQSPKGHTTLWKYLKDLELKELLSSAYGALPKGRGRTQLLSMPNTLQPSLTSCFDVSKPIPEDAPVTIADLFNFFPYFAFSVFHGVF